MEHHRKKNIWGLEPASLITSQQMICSRPSFIPKKGCIKPGVKQHCLFPFA